MSTSHIVVTGAAGHLGSHLAPALVEAGFDVTGLDIIEPACAPAGWRCLEVDLTASATLQSALTGADLIVHCASLHPWKPYTDDQYLDSIVAGTWNVYAAAARLGIRAVVLTSSIAAAGYHRVPTEAWPVGEEQQFPLGDLYSFTKHAQEDVARIFVDAGTIRTIALRPPAFMPRSELETGFLLTGAFAVVEDIVAAHVAAVRLLTGGQETEAPVRAFEAVNVTNKLPYTREDAALLGPDGNVRRLVERHWPRAYQWLIARGYEGAHLPAVYDLSKAERLLGWRPACNFEQWFAEHGEGSPA
jgi:nucleoside-diphosphate-sugar epimerase